jgi:hypothetical protein
MSELKAKFISKDENTQNENNTYWFRVDGYSASFGLEFENETFGLVESEEGSCLVDCDGCTVTPGDGQHDAVMSIITVTDEERSS